MPFIPDSNQTGFIPDEPIQKPKSFLQSFLERGKVGPNGVTGRTQEEQIKSLNSLGSIVGLDILGKTIGGGIAYAADPNVRKYSNEVLSDMPTLQQNTGAAIKLASTVAPWSKIPIIGAGIRGALAGGSYGLGQAMTEKQGIEDTAKTTGMYALGGSIFSKGTEYALSRLPKALSIFTGESYDAIEQALKDPKAADIGINGGDEQLRKTVQEGADRSVKIRNEFINRFSQKMEKLMGSKKQSFIQKDLMDGLDKLIRTKNVEVGEKGLDFSTSRIVANPGEASNIQKVYDAINNWKDFSARGIIELKRLVGDLSRFPKEGGGTSKSPVLGSYYNYLDELIKKRIPVKSAKAYELLNKNFEENIGLYDDMVKAFNSKDPFTKIANIFGKNNDKLRQIVDFYEKHTGTKIAPIVAGREMGMEKQGGQNFLMPLRQVFDFILDPKLQAKAVTGIGKRINSLKSFMPKNTGQFLNQQTLNTFLKKPTNK